MLTKAKIEAAASSFGYKVTDVERAHSTAYHVSLKDERTDEKATIEVWQETTEQDLIGLLSRAASLTRQTTVHSASSTDWMM